MSYINIYVHDFLFKTRIYRVAVKALCEKEKNNDTKKKKTKKKKAKNKPMTERFLPEVKFQSGCLFLLFENIFSDNFLCSLRSSNHHIVDKKNYT